MLKKISSHPAYTISHTGEITNPNGKILRSRLNNKGYPMITLTIGGKEHSLVSRLVAKTFLTNPEEKRCVCHKDNNPLNNDVRNLYWGTHKENTQQALKEGRLYQLIKKGENRTIRLPVTDVLFIRKNKTKLSLPSLAQEFNVAVSTIKSIIDNKTYKNSYYQL